MTPTTFRCIQPFKVCARGACEGCVRGGTCEGRVAYCTNTCIAGESLEGRFAPKVGKSVAGWTAKPVAAANVVDLSFLLCSQAVLPVATCLIC